MQTLPELQRAFGRSMLDADERALAADVVADGFTAGERLQIYRNTCRSTLVEALRLAYPSVNRLVGEDFFDAAAGRFIDRHPPRSAYLNEYGEGFADVLAGLKSLEVFSYVPDVARYEWALSVAANAPDVDALRPDALASALAEDPARLCFLAHPSLSVLALSHPADQIADAVLSGDEAAMAQVDVAGGPVRLVVHRGPEGLESHRLSVTAHEFISRLYAGATLAELAGAAPDEVAELLADQLVHGRLSGFECRP
jgi:hypothetical protein